MKVSKNIIFQASPIQRFAQRSLNTLFEPFLFNTVPHLYLQKNPNCWVFWAEKANHILIQCNVFTDDKIGCSPWRMSFGGIEFYNQIHYQHLQDFITFIEKFCKNELHLQKLHIVQYPFSYAVANSHLLTQVLLQNNFQIINQELTHYIITENFRKENFHTCEQRRLRKAIQAEFYFEQLHNPDWQHIYHFVAQARKRKNFPITMSWQDFQHTVESFPEKYLAFAVKKQNQVAAVSVAIVINSSILYSFYPADSPEFLAYSPTVLLNWGLIEFCQKKGFRILDLGISTQAGKPNLGLIRFKRNLGAQSALKLSFAKEI